MDSGKGSFVSMKEGILSTLQTCHNAGAELSLLKAIIAMFRRYYTGQAGLKGYLDDMEVRFITSLEGTADEQNADDFQSP